MAGDAPESNSGRYFVMRNSFDRGWTLLSSLYRARGWCWRIKKAKEPVSIRGSFACDFLHYYRAGYILQRQDLPDKSFGGIATPLSFGFLA
jgi:hypothetical protein